MRLERKRPPYHNCRCCCDDGRGCGGDRGSSSSSPPPLPRCNRFFIRFIFRFVQMILLLHASPRLYPLVHAPNSFVIVVFQKSGLPKEITASACALRLQFFELGRPYKSNSRRRYEYEAVFPMIKRHPSPTLKINCVFSHRIPVRTIAMRIL